MNLQRAFVVRSRLTKNYAQLEREFENLNPITEAGKELKVNPDMLFDKLREAGEMLALMNAAIDKANGNSEARVILSRQENIRRLSLQVLRIAKKVEDFEPQKLEYDSYLFDEKNQTKGMYVSKEYTLHTQRDWENELKSLEKEMRKLEDELSEVNAEAVVEVPQKVLDYLGTI